MKCSQVAVLWLYTVFSVHVSADYVVEVTVHSYDNPTNEAAAYLSLLSRFSHCCDSVGSREEHDGVCTGEERCDNYFRYCLSSFDSPIGICRPGFSSRSNTSFNGAPINFSQPIVLGLPNPLTLSGLSTTWQGVQLFVEVRDTDEDSFNGDLVEAFSIDILSPAGVSTQNLTMGRFGFASLGWSVRVLCTEDFFGEYCNCRNNSCSGRGECVSEFDNFTCICDPQYTGQRCELINFCYQQNCSDRGTCEIGGSNYTCSCDPGFTGRDCEVDINDCVNISCNARGNCLDLINDYRCDCQPGYTGRDCEVDINECDGRTCSDQGLCRDLVNDYMCDCFGGFTGRDCDVNIDYCVGISCNGRGMCVDLINDYECDCGQSGYTGRDCELDIDECSLMPSVCNNRGNCSNSMGSFNCSCQPGFTGQNCSELNLCEVITCSDQGNCTQSSDAVNNFECECEPGFTGIICELNINDCAGVSCSFNGQCEDLVEGFRCDCQPGFTGDLCQTNIDDCVSVNCTNGQCVDGVDSFSCDCEPGYTGRLCNFRTNAGRASPGGIIGGVVGALLLLVLGFVLALGLTVLLLLVRARARDRYSVDIMTTKSVQ